MACSAHTDKVVIARCTSCGEHLCGGCFDRKDGKFVCRSCSGPAAPARFVQLRVLPGATMPAIALAPRPVRQPRPALAGALGLVPGVGHCYAGAWLRGLGILFFLAPIAVILLYAGVLPATGYVFFHGLLAFDGYRIARKRRGEWSREDAREARGVWLSTAVVLLAIAIARAAGAPVTASLAWPAFLIPLGVGLALSGRKPEGKPAAEPGKPAPAPEPAEPKPGATIDRRADRAALAQQLSA
ncbi:hypothetical protein HY251_18485 [bacterium]|nr:hypothetical protein [bacterium]